MHSPLRIFLCHAAQDGPVVQKLHHYLKQHGVQPWMAELDLPPGKTRETGIQHALLTSDILLVCLSRNSADAGDRLSREITFALETARTRPGGAPRIIPARLDKCAIPDGLNRYPAVDLFGAEGGQRLLESLTPGVQAPPAAQPAPAAQKKPLDAIHWKVPPPRRKTTPQVPWLWLGLGGITLLLIACAALGMFYWVNRSATPVIPVAAPTQMPALAASTAAIPTLTSTPTLIPLANASPQPVLLPTQAAVPSLIPSPTPVSVTGSDGMTLLYVPAGTFSMGNPIEEAMAQCEQAGGPCTRDLENEQPRHEVHLDAYWIDKTEVTNGMYRQCVASGACEPPVQFDAPAHAPYYGNPTFDDYPVVHVTWEMARKYCAWAGRQLPSEAQWEKAARGTDARVYPWGNQAPNSGLLNYRGNPNGLMKVGSFPFGASPYGVLDMSGNAFEWIFDWYAKDYYQRSPASNPTGPDSGKGRVVRGGSWDSAGNFTRAGFRWGHTPSKASDFIGFRCALPQP
ncbi:MAG: SUMF1/EgtB/PvdO family nonheme iron enzyme [Chloroflexota bacterium]